MHLDGAVVASLVCQLQPSSYLRSTPWIHRATPLGMGFGKTRFASPLDAFKLLYIAEDLPTSVAEAIIRDRFEGSSKRELTRAEVAGWGVCEVTASKPLHMLDLRGGGCLSLGISTDIAGGKAQDEAREFSQALYDTTKVDGIVYRSRLLKDRECLAVYDRASSKLRPGPVVEMERLVALVPSLATLKITLV